MLEINKLLSLHQVFFYITLPTSMMHGETQIKHLLILVNNYSANCGPVIVIINLLFQDTDCYCLMEGINTFLK